MLLVHLKLAMALLHGSEVEHVALFKPTLGCDNKAFFKIFLNINIAEIFFFLPQIDLLLT